jgi:hypothetical protein
VLLLLAFATGMLPWLVAPSPVWLGIAVLVGCVPLAPALAISSALLGEWAPAGTVTEAFTWNGTGLAGGMAAGSAAAGALAHAAPRAPFALAVAAILLAALWTAWRARRGAFRTAGRSRRTSTAPCASSA